MKIISNIISRVIALLNAFLYGPVSRDSAHSSSQELMPAFIRIDNIETRHRRKKGL